ncbi:MAG TPA: FG-GAP-like repeat-containing protein [Ignavibacteria bacterium]|nr:FG-GAP-like repeat-containing protein [Ignavibacteria bacterium]
MKKIIIFSFFLFVILGAFINFLTINSEANERSVYFRDVSQTNLPHSVIQGASMDIETADVDNDGDLDVILAREFTPNKLLLNDGNGIFSDGTIGRLPQYNFDSEDIGIADFDNDGDVDIIFGSEDNAVHEFYLNNGQGVFTMQAGVIPNGISNALLVIDLNNDGYQDIIMGLMAPGNPAPPTLPRVLINNGNATFRDETSLRMPETQMTPQDIKAGDLDGDGDLDLVWGNETGNKIFMNNGSGVFTDQSDMRLTISGLEETRKVTLGDVDNDGDLDIFFSNVAFRPGMNRSDRLLINNGQGFFTDESSTRLPFDFEHTTDAVFYDFDFDGDLDMFVSVSFSNMVVRAYRNNGQGFFEDATSDIMPAETLVESLALKLADLNGDSLPDLYMAHRRRVANDGYDKLLIRNDTATVGISFFGNESVNDFKLNQNFPNPFNPETKIKFSVLNQSDVTNLSIYDFTGKLIETLVNQKLTSGVYEYNFNGKNLPSGIYLYVLKSGSKFESKKMTLIK